ncbi:hypothetical protein ACSLNR_29285, partial [Escherichia coli]|uniref:hypothetical protein n=1 Tax=Escherichia coli TaxID=562 RepID=UPI003EE16209
NSFLQQTQNPHQQETVHLYFFSICKEPYQTQPVRYSGRNVHSEIALAGRKDSDLFNKAVDKSHSINNNLMLV